MKLSEAQARALGKLTGEWQSAYELWEKLNMLDSLVKKGLAESYRNQGIKAILCPNNYYRLKDGGENR